ncbi:exonuclease 3-5 domain containing protein [Reticulomyxa filosa]|uniref:Exonuclease 3-5 domain containing protein n=1 Tax=Reticulomyxa filosa TaxID=46433 RepID=X6MNG5_RETFI|nr:exonuclease 3-5 domain containing protein [Reticulomyxa filosa]|eukprot:ETO15364.1 exonuclease 3-5 domain containing protein [Reticulomyxa filosa]
MEVMTKLRSISWLEVVVWICLTWASVYLIWKYKRVKKEREPRLRGEKAKERKQRGVRIVVCNDVVSVEENVKQLLKQEPTCIGLDCEWKPYFSGEAVNRISLLQLAAFDICILIQMQQLQYIPQELIDILQNKKEKKRTDSFFFKKKRVWKVGVNITGDAKKLFEDYSISVRGCIELTHMLKQSVFYEDMVTSYVPSQLQSLEGKNNNEEEKSIPQQQIYRLDDLAKKFLNVAMKKSKEITLSNWELTHLSEDQLFYAADDSIISLFLFVTLCHCYSLSYSQFLTFRNNIFLEKRKCATLPSSASSSTLESACDLLEPLDETLFYRDLYDQIRATPKFLLASKFVDGCASDHKVEKLEHKIVRKKKAQTLDDGSISPSSSSLSDSNSKSCNSKLYRTQMYTRKTNAFCHLFK